MAEIPEELAWVTDAQRDLLETTDDARDDWTGWLSSELDRNWADWRAADQESLRSWLNELLLSRDAGRAEAFESPAGPEQLAWVTADQQAQLEILAGARGDWRSWLPEELDQIWSPWRSADPQELTPWLDGLMPALTGSPIESVAAATPGDGEPASTAAARLAEVINAELARAVAENPQLSRLTPEQLQYFAHQGLVGVLKEQLPS